MDRVATATSLHVLDAQGGRLGPESPVEPTVVAERSVRGAPDADTPDGVVREAGAEVRDVDPLAAGLHPAGIRDDVRRVPLLESGRRRACGVGADVRRAAS